MKIHNIIIGGVNLLVNSILTKSNTLWKPDFLIKDIRCLLSYFKHGNLAHIKGIKLSS